MDARGITVPDLLVALNDPERPMELKETDKSQVYRWLKGQMPQPSAQRRLAAALSLDDPGILLRDPIDDWFARFFEDRDRDELERMKTMLEAAFPRLRRA